MKNVEKSLLNLIGNIEIVNKGENNRIICGYGNVAIIDSERQFIPLETLKSGLKSLLTDMSYANLMLGHQNIQIGKILKKWGKLTTHVDDKGAFIVAKIREDIEIANETWEKILKGAINGFSIGCELLTDPRKVCDVNGENCVDYLDNINILEVSVCERPINPLSGFTIISKSDSKGKDVCVSCGIKLEEEKNMTEEVKVEPKVETKEEPREISIEERLEAMERTIFNIQAAITKMGEAQKSEEEELAKKPEDEKPEEVVPPEEEEEEKKPAEAPCKSEDILTKKDFDDFKKSLEESITRSIASIIESLKPKEQDQKIKSEMELALRARDDQIETLKKALDEYQQKQHIETVTKAEANAEPKTVQDNAQKVDEIPLEDDYPIVVSKGEVSFRKFVKSR